LIKLRVARPTDNLVKIADMYRKGLDFHVLSSFRGHDGFDGIILGMPDSPYHLEFTSKAGHQVGRAPTEDNLLVFYLGDKTEYLNRCKKMISAGFVQVKSFNPYWDQNGSTFEDTDGYRVVIVDGEWNK